MSIWMKNLNMLWMRMSFHFLTQVTKWMMIMIVCNDILNIIYCFLIINNYYYILFHWLKLLLNIVAKQVSDEMACALRLFDVKSRYNLTDKAFQQTMLAVNGGNISQYQVKKVLKSIVKLKPIWIDICINSCCAYTGQYKDHVQCEYCEAPRFQDILANKNHISRRQMAYFSIKDRLTIQYQDPNHSKELRYHANYIHDNFKIEDVFDSKRYQELL